MSLDHPHPVWNLWAVISFPISKCSLIVCPGFPAESNTLSEKKVCLCVSVECRWMHMNREGARGEGESMRNLGKSIAYLLIFVSEWMSEDWFAHVTLRVCVCVCVCVCV